MHYLRIGGVVAVGFDPTGEYLLVITHSGRGVFSTRTWERVARDTQLAYPENGMGVGIGPIAGQAIAVTEMDYKSGRMRVASPDGQILLGCESSGIAILVGGDQMQVPLTRRQLLKDSFGWLAIGMMMVILGGGCWALWIWLAEKTAGHWWCVPLLLISLLPCIPAVLMLLLGGISLVNAAGGFWCFLTGKSVEQESLRLPQSQGPTADGPG